MSGLMLLLLFILGTSIIALTGANGNYHLLQLYNITITCDAAFSGSGLILAQN